MADVSARRTGYKVSNMLIALGVMLAIIVAVVFLVPRRSYDAVKVVDTSTVIQSAQRLAPYHVLVPSTLPIGWRSTSVRLSPPQREGDPVGLHIGYVTPGTPTQYAALEESNAESLAFIKLMTQHGKYAGAKIINGLLWEQRYSAERDVRSLNRTFGVVTVVVTGTASYDELAVLASSLR